jgi:hypothetical protein
MRPAWLVILTIAVSFVLAGAAADSRERVSTVADRDGLNVTIYNGGTALIHDRRRMTLRTGLNQIAWRDVSAFMDPTSALLQSTGSGNPIHVVEQNFDFDLLDSGTVLQKYVGKTVKVLHEARFAGERDSEETARILSANNGSVVLQYGNRIETELRGHILYPRLPSGFRDRPTLVLDLDSDHAGFRTLDLSYLTSGLTWRVDYVGALSADEKSLSLAGLVTLSNTSGVDYDDARLQLVAGNVNIAQPESAGLKTIAHITNVVSAAQPTEESYFEYHLYTMPRRTTILDKQTKQIALLSAQGVPVQKTLELRGLAYYYQGPAPDLGDRLRVGVYVTFRNRGGDLGIPLPGGIVRIYKNDSRGLSQFVGSDSIDHTPRNETVRLHLGDSFDVTARKRQTDFHLLGPCYADSSYEIVISNAKDVAQDVLVVEPIPGDWTIVSENMPHTKSSSSTASWNVLVPADASSTLTYTSQVKWCPL